MNKSITQFDQLPKLDFIRARCAVAYAFPGLHPDGYEDAESGWPRVLKRFAAEAWRRADAGELADDELYPCDAHGRSLRPDARHLEKKDFLFKWSVSFFRTGHGYQTLVLLL